VKKINNVFVTAEDQFQSTTGFSIFDCQRRCQEKRKWEKRERELTQHWCATASSEGPKPNLFLPPRSRHLALVFWTARQEERNKPTNEDAKRNENERNERESSHSTGVRQLPPKVRNLISFYHHALDTSLLFWTTKQEERKQTHRQKDAKKTKMRETRERAHTALVCDSFLRRSET
jgi:hypothetical protein